MIRILLTLAALLWLTAPAEANRLFLSGFELQSLTAGIEWQSWNAGAHAISTTTFRSGAASLRINSLASGTKEGPEHTFTAATEAEHFFRFYLRVATAPGGITTIWEVNEAGVQQVALELTTAPALRFLVDETQVGSDSSTLSLNTWYRVEVRFDADNAGGSDIAEARIDGSEFAGSTTLTIAGQLEVLAVGGNLDAETVTTGDWFIDDVGVNDILGSNQTTWLGEGNIHALHPNGEGDADAGTNSFVGTGCASGTVAGCWDETTPDDGTTMVGLDSTTSTVDVAVEDSSVISGMDSDDQVNLVAVTIRYQAEGTGATLVLSRIKSQASGTVNSSADLSTCLCTTWWTHDDASPFIVNHVTYVDPQDSSAWTKADLDGIQVGANGTDGNPDVNVSMVIAQVEWKAFDGGGGGFLPRLMLLGIGEGLEQ